jgi:hypothetical protein
MESHGVFKARISTPMPLIHNPQIKSDIERRINALTPDHRPTWGKMSVDQMLWHVNQALGLSLGTVTVGPGGPGIPAWLMRTMVINMPWPKGGPTHPDFVAKKQYDFDSERARLLAQIADLTTRPMNGAWPTHPAFGNMSGKQVSTLTHKHLNHHLTQFGV